MTDRQTASDEPLSEGDPLQAPPRCLSFDIAGDWAHFRRVDGSVVKQTYKIPPRTTVAGLLAAVIGCDRDEYYEAFRLARSAIAIQPHFDLRTTNLPTNILSTTKAKLQRPEGATRRKTVQVRYPKPTVKRQQHNFEMLVEPRYSIYAYTEDKAFYNELRTKLLEGRSHYTPSLGLSECLARITSAQEHTGDSIQLADPEEAVTEVDSVVPYDIDSVVPNGRIEFERTPAAMEKVFPGGRRPTAFRDVAYTPNGPLEIRTHDTTLMTVDDRTVVFG